MVLCEFVDGDGGRRILAGKVNPYPEYRSIALTTNLCFPPG